MGYDYTDLPYCRDCKLTVSQDEKFECAVYWRPQTGTKTGFPTEDGWNCPKDSFDAKTLRKIIEQYKRAIVLLEATKTLLNKIEFNYHLGSNSNPLDEVIVYDNEEMDGCALLEDINELLEEAGAKELE